MKPATHKTGATLFKPAPVVRWAHGAVARQHLRVGQQGLRGRNPRPGAHIYYALSKKAGELRLEVKDFTNKTLAVLQAPNAPGLHRVTWGGGQFAGGGGIGGGVRGGPLRQAPPPGPGQYRVVLTVDGKEQSAGLRIERDPNVPEAVGTAEEAPAKRPRGPMDY